MSHAGDPIKPITLLGNKTGCVQPYGTRDSTATPDESTAHVPPRPPKQHQREAQSMLSDRVHSPKPSLLPPLSLSLFASIFAAPLSSSSSSSSSSSKSAIRSAFEGGAFSSSFDADPPAVAPAACPLAALRGLGQGIREKGKERVEGEAFRVAGSGMKVTGSRLRCFRHQHMVRAKPPDTKCHIGQKDYRCRPLDRIEYLAQVLLPSVRARRRSNACLHGTAAADEKQRRGWCTAAVLSNKQDKT